MAGLEPQGVEIQSDSLVEPQGGETVSVPADAGETTNAQLAKVDIAAPASCSGLVGDHCAEVAVPDQEPAAAAGNSPACTLPGEHAPTGALVVVPSTTTSPTENNVVRLRVEVEEGLSVDADCFATTAITILTDERGWITVEDVTFVQVADDSYDFRLVLASPSTTDSLCYPAATGGKYSCRNGDKVLINLMRWETGTDDYADNLMTYRHYLLNHEVGHFLGRSHLTCRTPGEPAPVMMQQTKGLGECLPNGWPTEDEE